MSGKVAAIRSASGWGRGFVLLEKKRGRSVGRPVGPFTEGEDVEAEATSLEELVDCLFPFFAAGAAGGPEGCLGALEVAWP